MRIGVALAMVGLYCLLCRPAMALPQSPSEKLLIAAKSASTWMAANEPGVSVVTLDGGVRIELDRSTLESRQAVIWLSRGPDGSPTRQHAQIALLGNATLKQGSVLRSGDRLLVTAEIDGAVRITADQRTPRDLSDTPLYQQGDALRKQAQAGIDADAPPTPADAIGAFPTTAASMPTSRPAPLRPIDATPTEAAPLPPITPTGPKRFLELQGSPQTINISDGTVAAVLNGPLTFVETRPTGEILELKAQRGVFFTPFKSLRELQKIDAVKGIQDYVTAAYLEGDVRVVLTPATGVVFEQRLQANRVYYEFGTDRAILTDAVVHMLEPTQQIPIIVRAKTIRQLSQGEYRAQGVQLSTSAFALPSYALAADKIYVRRLGADEADGGSGMAFNAEGATFDMFGLPFFYFPAIGGTMTDRGSALRNISFGNSTALGVRAETEWGLFETLGKPHPRDLDITYEANYYSDRGPAFGLNGDYQGGFLTSVDKERWSFKGDFKSFLVYDEGFDQFGRATTRLSDEGEIRGRAIWQHQHFLPNDFQIQLRAGYVSDPTFLEQWFERDFDEKPPHDVSAYVKKQTQNEAYTLFANVQPRDFVTSSDFLQEQFEVEHLPEVGYRRYGDSLLNDQLTFHSENTLGGLRFHNSDATLADQGFVPGLSPGLPSVGFTGTPGDVVVRSDLRQEISYPLQLGRFKFVPFAVGRYTAYSDSPEGATEHRLLGGIGARLGTSFWRVDDAVQSRLFDINRIRHVVEPQVSVFTSASTIDRGEVYQYEEDVDSINDLSAVQLALRQRWQTKRGGPGRWRNVDFLTLNVEANFFSNKPDSTALAPENFRGLYFGSEPEASLPRDSVNADATWRISDQTVLLADVQYNLDKSELATAGVGLIARRDERLTYFLGNRYIEELGSNITTAAAWYQISPKYTIAVSQSFDFGLGQNVASSIQFVRYFDRFIAAIKIYHNSSTDQSGFGFNIFPTGVGYGLDSDVVGSVFREKP